MSTTRFFSGGEKLYETEADGKVNPRTYAGTGKTEVGTKKHFLRLRRKTAAQELDDVINLNEKIAETATAIRKAQTEKLNEELLRTKGKKIAAQKSREEEYNSRRRKVENHLKEFIGGYVLAGMREGNFFSGFTRPEYEEPLIQKLEARIRAAAAGQNSYDGDNLKLLFDSLDQYRADKKSGKEPKMPNVNYPPRPKIVRVPQTEKADAVIQDTRTENLTAGSLFLKDEELRELMTKCENAHNATSLLNVIETCRQLGDSQRDALMKYFVPAAEKVVRLYNEKGWNSSGNQKALNQIREFCRPYKNII